MLGSQQVPNIKDDVQAVANALKKARTSFDQGKTRPISFRISQLINLKKGIQSMAKDLTEAVQKDLGREAFSTWFAELSIIEHEIDHTVQHLKQWVKPQSVDTAMFLGPARSKIVYEPLGVVCVMGSWNFPIYTTIGPLIHVIGAGNTAVIKPSEIAPHTLMKIKALCTRWLDMNCYVCIEGQVQVAIALTSTKFDNICFTGSTEKGKLVASAAGKNLVPCVLELGGKSPSIVDESADIDVAAKKIALGRFLNSGQICISPDYVFVHYSKTQKFIELMNKYIKEFWSDGANVKDMGRVVNDFHKNRLCELLRDHKGRVVIGNPNAYDDQNLTPTVILNPAQDSDVMKDEIFGPILPLFSFDNFDDVIKQIKSHDKPLVMYYFGKNGSKNYQRLESETSSGALVTNEVLFQIVNPNLPFGGVGGSGYGRYHGYEGFKNFSNAKSIMLKPALNMYPYTKLFPPFTADKQKLIKMLIANLKPTQCQMAKRFIYLIVLLVILRGVTKGQINKTTFDKIKTFVVEVWALFKKTFTQ